MICWGQRSRCYWHRACDRVIDSSSQECKCENPAQGRLSCQRVQSDTGGSTGAQATAIFPEEQHGKRLLRLGLSVFKQKLSEMPAEESQKGYYIKGSGG